MDLHDDNCCCDDCLDDMETTVDAYERHCLEAERGDRAKISLLPYKGPKLPHLDDDMDGLPF